MSEPRGEHLREIPDPGATGPDGVDGVDGVGGGPGGAILVVTARGVGVVHDGRTVLDGVDLTVRPGSLLAVTGPSGAGKTSLLWVLAGLQRPSRGVVLLSEAQRVGRHAAAGPEDGDDPPAVLLRSGTPPAGEAGDGDPAAGPDGRSGTDRDAFASAGVVVIPQGNALATVLTAMENVVVPLLAAGVPAERAHARAAQALEAVGLGSAAGQLIEELSGGQQQRVAVARGLAQRGAVVLADEPTSELDSVNRARVVELLREEARRGASVVMATHDPEAAAACDGELHLDDGVPTWTRTLAASGARP